jgi:hypothetical protein
LPPHLATVYFFVMRGKLARNLARDADLFVVPVEDYGAVRVNRGVLEVGPNASHDAIATVACRRQLQLDGITDEASVRELVERFGFNYEPQEVPERESKISGIGYCAVS